MADGLLLVSSVVSGSCYDLGRDPPSGKWNGASSTADQTSALQAALDRIGAGPDPLYAPIFLPGRIVKLTTVVIPAICGGTIVTGGGLTPVNNNNSRGIQTGSALWWVYDQETADDTAGPALRYWGCGWDIGPINLRGFDIPDQAALNDIDNVAKTDIGFLIHSNQVGGVPTGKLHASFTLCGFVDGIAVGMWDGDTNCDCLDFPDIWAEHCTNGIHWVSNQSIANHIGRYLVGPSLTRAIYVEGGGDIHVDQMIVDNPTTIFETADGYAAADSDQPVIIANGIKIDNNADNLVICKLGTHSSPITASFTGSIAAGCTINPATIVQGVAGTDKVFFNFTGYPTSAGIINEFSTVDAEGNFLT